MFTSAARHSTSSARSTKRFHPVTARRWTFLQRCLLQGLNHVVADDVFVFHQGGSSFSDEGADIQAEHEELIRARYPYYPDTVKAVERGILGPLRALWLLPALHSAASP